MSSLFLLLHSSLVGALCCGAALGSFFKAIVVIVGLLAASESSASFCFPDLFLRVLRSAQRCLRNSILKALGLEFAPSAQICRGKCWFLQGKRLLSAFSFFSFQKIFFYRKIGVAASSRCEATLPESSGLNGCEDARSFSPISLRCYIF